jgi:hypothetical protein
MTDTYSSQPQPPVPGLLSPDTSDAKSQAIMALGAGLIKAGGPSETKNTFSGVGDAINSGLDSYRKATTQALQNAYLKQQITKEQLGTAMQALDARNTAAGLGLPEHPAITSILGPMPVGAAPQANPAPAAPPAAPTGAPPALQGLVSANPGAPIVPQQGNGPVVASTGGGSILPGGAQIMGGEPPRPSGLLSPPGGPAPASGAQMAFNDRIPPNGGMPGASPSGPPPGLLSPPMPTPRPQSAPQPQGPQLRLASVIGAPSIPPPAAASAAPVPATPAAAPGPQGQPGAPNPFANLTLQQRQLLAGKSPQAALLLKSLEPTPEMLNARASGFNSPLDYENSKLVGAANAKQYNLLSEGLSGAAMVGQNTAPLLQVAGALLKDPQIMTGAGSDAMLQLRRVGASLGIDTAGAQPQEAFHKVLAATILQQTNQLKAESEAMGAQGGRVFGAQIDLMTKAGLSTDNSPAGNQWLVNVLTRTNDRVQKIADMANGWKETHGGTLNAAFDTKLRQWMGAPENQLFTPKELENQRLIGNPDAGKPTHFASDGKGGRLGYVNGQMVPVDKDGTPLPNVGQSR